MKLTDKQQAAMAMLSGSALHNMLYGGSRSGKTFLLVRAVCARAIKAPSSRHAILRFRLNAIKASIMMDTFPKVMRACFPGVKTETNKSDFYTAFENGSHVFYGGLDDKERTEKILGQEYATLLFNECSQIPFHSYGTALTRLAQKVDQVIDGVASPLPVRAYYDANPPSKAHWTYKLFHDKVDPETKRALSHPDNYAWMQMNPKDNAENLSANYLQTLEALSPRLRKRFFDGEFADATPNALFVDEVIDRWRVLDGKVPEFVRVVVGVDPSGSGDEDNADNDAIGITVGGLGTDGNAYLLEDCTVKAGPGTWGRIATSAFDRHQANVIVGEVNYGGEMVRQTIQTSRPRTPYKAVTASRGKHVRAEPFSALYEQGKVRHAGIFQELEDELTAMSTIGYTGIGSPNRADSWIWVLSELFPGMTKAEEEVVKEEEQDYSIIGGGGWMAA